MTGPDGLLTAGLADVVARLRRAMRRSARVRMTSSLSVAQLELLSLVDEHPQVRSGELARMLRLAPNSVSTLTNALSAAGMVERVSDPADGRSVGFVLTDAAQAQVRSWRETNQAALAAAVGALSAQDGALLVEALPALDRLVAALDEQTDEETDPRSAGRPSP